MREDLCGHVFSASTISHINEGLDGALARFANRPLEEVYLCLILDARYEKVRVDGVIHSQSVPIAIGINRRGAAKCWLWDYPVRELRRGRQQPSELPWMQARALAPIRRSLSYSCGFFCTPNVECIRAMASLNHMACTAACAPVRLQRGASLTREGRTPALRSIQLLCIPTGIINDSVR